uniref:Uncharacterized protein n=1 Tax=Oryza meridionalis TaxID=40149 RepID=A0A0E0CH47_9ORYZ
MAMGGIGGAAASTSSVPAMAAAAAVAPPPFWSTPTPYLFIGFGVVMALIAVALAVLLCTRRKDGGRGVGGEEGGDVVSPGMMSVRVLAPLDREAPPRVVVVMAGDDSPSFLASATPLAFAAAAATGVPLAPEAKVAPPPQP